MATNLALEHDRALRRESVFHDRLDPLSLSDRELMRYYRLPRRKLISLIDELELHLQRRTMRLHAIPTHTQVLSALKIYANA